MNPNEGNKAYAYDGTWEDWKHGKLPEILGVYRCNCPECLRIRREKAAAIERSEQRAQEYKRNNFGAWANEPLYGKSPSLETLKTIQALKDGINKSMFDALIYGKGAYVVPKFEGYTPKWYAWDEVAMTSTAPKQDETPKHRKAVKKVAKEAVKTANAKADEHADEAVDMIEDARDILKAADAFIGMRVHDVSHYLSSDGKVGSVTFELVKIDQEEIESVREDYVDKAVYMAWINGGAGLALDVQALTQKAGRDLLAKSTLSLTRLMTPEIVAMTAAAQAANAANADAAKVAKAA